MSPSPNQTTGVKSRIVDGAEGRPAGGELQRPGAVRGCLHRVAGLHAAEEGALLERHALLARHSRDVMLCVRSEDGRILEANEAAIAAYGYTRAELLDLRIYDLRERATEGLTSAQMAQAGDQGICFETLHRRKDGSTFPVEVTSQGATFQGDRMLVSVVRDISERRQVLERLRQSEAQLQTIVEGLHEGVVVSDLEGTLLHWNRAALDMHGFESLEDCRRKLPELTRIFELSTLEGAVLPLEEWPLNRILRGEHLQELEIRLRTLAGGWERTFSYGGRLVRDASGRSIMAVVTVRDVSERKRAEAERERLLLQLADARRLESIGRLAGGLAHDFNNLLAVILSCAGALRDDLASGEPPSGEDVDEIAGAGSRARDLVRQLLAFARRQEISPRAVELNEVVRQGGALLRRAVGEGVAVILTAASAPCPVFCDPSQVEHALLNLAINARDAMPRGGTLTLETAHVRLDGSEPGADHEPRIGSFVRLRVADTGVGMTPEAKARAFEPFFTTKPQGQGTGLGLATVYGAVKQAGGFITVESVEGRGTTFDLYFPLVG